MSPHQSFYVGVERPGKLILIHHRVRGRRPSNFLRPRKEGREENVYATLKIF